MKNRLLIDDGCYIDDNHLPFKLDINMYQIGHYYGIDIIRVHKEFVTRDYRTERWVYHPTVYYVKYENKLWFLEDYRLISLMAEQKRRCMSIIWLSKYIKIKLMLD